MKLYQIKDKADQETINLTTELAQIAKLRSQHPDGYDLKIHPGISLKLEQYCDAHNIPVYLVSWDCLSIANTYSQLYQKEIMR